MKDSRAIKRGRFAFTLIELLVVIAVIGILAAMILPALIGAKEKTKEVSSKTEMSSLVAAVAQYQSDNSRLPASASPLTAANQNTADFTFGTQSTIAGTSLAAPANIINTYNYQDYNSDVISILTADSNYRGGSSVAYNQRKTVYFSSKVSAANQAGIGSDGVLRDPWAQPYIVVLDLNYDDKCILQDPNDYSKVLTNPGNVMIWSFGSPSAAKNTTHLNGKPIVSWK